MTEQSSVVWSSSITTEDSDELERTQKVALKIIYRHEYESYENALVLFRCERQHCSTTHPRQRQNKLPPEQNLSTQNPLYSIHPYLDLNC